MVLSLFIHTRIAMRCHMTRSAREFIRQFSISEPSVGYSYHCGWCRESINEGAEWPRFERNQSHSMGREGCSAARLGASLHSNGTSSEPSACLFWGGCYEVLRQRNRPHRVTRPAADAMAIAAVAYVVDYHLIPKRFTPGFELVFSRRLFPLLYLGLAGARWRSLCRFSMRRENTARLSQERHPKRAELADYLLR